MNDLLSIGPRSVLWIGLALAPRGRKIRPSGASAPKMAGEFPFSLRSIAVHSTVGLLASWMPPIEVALHQIVRNILGHSGCERFPANRSDPPLISWLTTVTPHDLLRAKAGWNYGLDFTHWDRLMATEHPAYVERCADAVRKQPEQPVSQETCAVSLPHGRGDGTR